MRGGQLQADEVEQREVRQRRPVGVGGVLGDEQGVEEQIRPIRR